MPAVSCTAWPARGGDGTACNWRLSGATASAMLTASSDFPELSQTRTWKLPGWAKTWLWFGPPLSLLPSPYSQCRPPEAKFWAVKTTAWLARGALGTALNWRLSGSTATWHWLNSGVSPLKSKALTV